MAGDFQLNFDIQASVLSGMETPARSRVRYLPATSVSKAHCIDTILTLAVENASVVELGGPKSTAWTPDRCFAIMELVPGGTYARIKRNRTPNGGSTQIDRYYTLTTERPRAYYFGDRTTAAIISGSTSTERSLTLLAGDPVAVRGFVFFSS